jgi:AAA15 family ATPase/GTPase
MDDKYISRHINKLMLDPNNYRFIDHKDYKKVPDDKISDKRVQERTYNLIAGKNEEEINDLITSFKANGVLKLDPIQVKNLSDGNLIVIEGNRRTVALKYLYEQYQQGFDVGKLTEADFKSVEVVLISDESSVQHMITMGLHHISGKKKWSPVNQAQLIHDLRYVHHLSEEEITNSLAITKHNLRRSLRVLSLIERYKESDFGDQFQTNMYSIFEEVIKTVEMKSWLEWDDESMSPRNTVRMEKLFSWISKDEVIERNEDGVEQSYTKEPIITKSHEIRDLSKFINEPKAVTQMEEARSITAGFVLSDAVGESRLRNSIENISKEVQTAFQFSEFMTNEDFEKIQKMKNKLDKLIPSSANVDFSERKSSYYFHDIKHQFTSIVIQNYRRLKNIEIKNLSRVNIFAGGNNTGKTSILELFYLFTKLNTIQSFIELERFRARFYQEFPANWFDKIFADDIQAEGVFNNILCSIEIQKYETSDPIDKSQYLNSVSAEANVNGDTFRSFIDLFSNKDPQMFMETGKYLCDATISSPYRYDGDLLRKAHAKAIQEKYYDQIIDFIRSKMDQTIEKIELVNIDKESRFMVSSSSIDHAIDITHYGEGLQRVFEVALLMGYSRNGVMCIDELDSAIHKSLLISFTEFIQVLADQFNVQVFLSTHSKECIDAFVENDYPDDHLTAYQLTEVDGKIICKYLRGNRLKQLVETINFDIR